LEILTEEEARAKPAGRAREEPNENPKLEAPQYDLCESISIFKKNLFSFFSDDQKHHFFGFHHHFVHLKILSGENRNGILLVDYF
jgi:hypothetical protein